MDEFAEAYRRDSQEATKELVKCPRCSNLVKPIRKANRQSMWHKAFIPFASYYGAFVWECPVCGYRLPKSEERDKDSAFEWKSSEEVNPVQISHSDAWVCAECRRINSPRAKICTKCGSERP